MIVDVKLTSKKRLPRYLRVVKQAELVAEQDNFQCNWYLKSNCVWETRNWWFYRFSLHRKAKINAAEISLHGYLIARLKVSFGDVAPGGDVTLVWPSSIFSMNIGNKDSFITPFGLGLFSDMLKFEDKN